MTDSEAPRPEASGEDLGDLLQDVLPPDRSTLGNLSAREALSRARSASTDQTRNSLECIWVQD